MISRWGSRLPEPANLPKSSCRPGGRLADPLGNLNCVVNQELLPDKAGYKVWEKNLRVTGGEIRVYAELEKLTIQQGAESLE